MIAALAALLLGLVVVVWLWREAAVDHRADRRRRTRGPYSVGNPAFADLIGHCGPLPPYSPQTQEDSCQPEPRATT